MAHVRSEGYGAEWIGIPDELLAIVKLYPAYRDGDELIFVVSRSDMDFQCFFAAERRSNGHETNDEFSGSIIPGGRAGRSFADCLSPDPENLARTFAF